MQKALFVICAAIDEYSPHLTHQAFKMGGCSSHILSGAKDKVGVLKSQINLVFFASSIFLSSFLDVWQYIKRNL